MAEGEMEGYSPLMASSEEVFLPFASTLIWGPVQVQSKKTLTTMFADVAWKSLVDDGEVKRVG